MTRYFPGVALLILSAASPLRAAQPLFPKPMHLVREINDSLAGRTARVDEYYGGDRAIAVRGDKTVIADYGKQELLEIDRSQGTWSLTTFADIGSARQGSIKMITKATATEGPRVVGKGSDHRLGRSVELLQADDPRAGLHADIAIDSSVTLTKDAFDVVAGGAFPSSGGPASDLVRLAAAHHSRESANTTSPATETKYGLPIEQQLRWKTGGGEVVVANRVTMIDDAVPPAELLVIPPGAKRVTSHILQAKRVAAESESLVPSRLPN